MLGWIAKRFRRDEDGLESARALRAKGELDAAREVCQALLKQQPRDALAMAMMAAIAADQDRFQEGEQWAQRALGVDAGCVPAHFALGRLMEGQGRFDLAEASYRDVVRLDPSHAKGQTNLGCMLHVQGRIDEATACYRKALQLEPGQPEALRNFALVAGGAGELKEALEGFERLVAERPHDGDAYCQLGHLRMQLGLYGSAMTAYERAIELEPERPDFRFSRAQLLLLLGDYEQGWREYEWRWRIANLNEPMTRFAQPRWDGRPLQGTLLVHSEPAFGDMFQFVRYVTLAAQRCTRVVVQCEAPMAELIAGIDGVAQVVRPGEPLPAFDAHLPPIAFPFTFGTTLDTVPWQGPYIKPDAQRVQQWFGRVNASNPRPFTVGLVWTGNPTNFSDRSRRVTLQTLGALAQAADVTFFSLQKGGESSQPGQVPPGMHFVDLTSEIRDFSDTAALISLLDLVITVDTSVAHLAGAMGHPVWVMLPHPPEWRWLRDRADSPWYPGMRLFRQQEQGDWDSVVLRLADALRLEAAASPA